ncbi:MAG: autotransporter-associated beta strand repeat-containing protein, partial [Verrucomicrobiota bacterium]
MKLKRLNFFFYYRVPQGVLLASIITICLGTAPATNIYWDGTGGNSWSTASSWNLNVGGTGADATVPGSSDIANFSISTINTAQTVSLGAAQSAAGLVFLGTNTAATTLLGGGTNRALTLGTSGITVNSGAGAVTLGAATGNAVTITLAGAQSWTNNSTNVLTETNAITNAGFLLTIAGTGNTTINGVLGGAGGLTKIDSGTLTLSGINTFTGPLTVEQGILQVATVNDASANGVFGNSATAVILGKTGGITGTLQYTGATASSTKKFTMATGGTGAFQVDASGTVLTLSGVIDGGGGLTKTGAGTLVLSGTNTFSGQLIVEQGILQVAAVNNASANGVLGNSASSVILGKTGGITGTLEYTGGGTTTSSTKKFTMATGGTGAFQVDTSGTVLTLSGEINGGGALTKTNSGTLVLTGSNTYTGATTISVGLLKLGAAGDATNTPLGTADAGTIVSATNAALDLNGFTLGTAEALTLNGTGISSGGALTNSSATAATYSGLLTLGSTSSIVASSGNLVLSNEGTISGAGFGLTLGGTATGSSLASIIGTGAGTLTKTGAGTWTLSGASTYTGLTTISVGTLKLGAGTSGSNTPLGTAATGTSVTSGATLDLNGNSITTAEALTLNGTGVGDVGALTNSSATAATYAGLITLEVASRIGGNSGDIILTNTGTITGVFDFRLEGSATGSSLASIIGIGAGVLFKSGTGTWTLTGANTYTGITRIEGGTLKLGAAGNGTNSPLGTVAGATGTQIGGALDLNGISLSTAEALTLRGTGVNSGGALTNTSATSATYKGDITMVADVSIVASGGNIILSSATDIAGTSVNLTVGGTKNTRIESDYAPNNGSTLTKEGTGTLTLTAANSYAGVTTVNAGVLNIQSATALGLVNQTGTSVTAGAALQIEKNLTNIIVTTETLTLNGGGINNDGALRNISGDNVWQATVTLGSASRINTDAGSLTFNTAANSITGTNQNLTLGGAGSGTVGGTITTGTGTLTKDGAGTWTLSGTNTYTGLTTVSEGTLTLGHATDTIANTAAVTVSGGTLAVPNTDAVGAVTLSSGTISGAGTLTGSSYALTNSGTVSAKLGGAGIVLTKTGAGAVTLSGANTYTGTTTVSAGTLVAGAAAPVSGSGAFGNAASAIILGDAATATNNSSPSLLIGGAFTVARDITIANQTTNGGYTLGGNTAASSTFSGAIALNKALTVTAITGGTVNLTKSISNASGTNTVNVTGAGSSNVILNNATTTNQFAPTLFSVNSGKLSLGASSQIADATNLTVAGGEFAIGAFNDTVGTVTLSSGTISGAGILTGASYALTNSGTVSAILNGTGALTKTGAGMATLSGANTYTDLTTVSTGTLEVTVNNALGTNAAGTTVTSGAALKLTGVNYAPVEALSLNGTGISSGGALVNSG